jgi:peroxiredoxin
MTALEAGTRAPSFSLAASSRDAGERREWFTDRDFRGRPLILAFYPADWSPVCGDQMALYNAVLPEFERLGAALLGVSVDGSFVLSSVPRDRKLRFSLLADFEEKGRMARDYGVYRASDGTAERALFVIDGDGRDPVELRLADQRESGCRWNPSRARISGRVGCRRGCRA